MSGRYTGVKSVDVACRIMGVFARRGAGLALKDIANDLRMPPSKVHRYMASLIGGGLIEKDPNTLHYALGPISYQVGLSAIASYDPLREVISTQIALRDEIDQTVTLSVWGNMGPTVVRVEESSHPIIMTMKVGAVLPVLATATGMVFAAFMPRTVTRPVVDRALTSQERANFIVSNRKDLDAELVEVRRLGYSANSEHLTRGVWALAVPVYNNSNSLVAVLAVMAHDDGILRHASKVVDFIRLRSPYPADGASKAKQSSRPALKRTPGH